MSLGEISGRPCLNNGSLGAYGGVVAQEQYRNHKVGTALGSLGDLVGPNADVADDAVLEAVHVRGKPCPVG